jgi:ribosomal protein S18 acetylase RimI-like enzyme
LYCSREPYYLRESSPHDAVDLQRACWTGATVDAVHELLARADAHQKSNRGGGMVAVVNNKAQAFGQITVWAQVVEISDLIVAPNLRGQGIGTAMIHALIERARQFRPVVEIGVAESNPRAKALYLRLGFVPDRSLFLDLGNGREQVMYLTLNLDERVE